MEMRKKKKKISMISNPVYILYLQFEILNERCVCQEGKIRSLIDPVRFVRGNVQVNIHYFSDDKIFVQPHREIIALHPEFCFTCSAIKFVPKKFISMK